MKFEIEEEAGGYVRNGDVLEWVWKKQEPEPREQEPPKRKPGRPKKKAEA